MKKPILPALPFVCIAVALAGCSALAGEKLGDGGDESTLKIRLGSQARYIEACSFSLSSVTEWTLTLTDESAADEKIVLSTAPSADGASSLSYADEVLTAKNISPGTYTAEISGSCTDSASGTACSIAGSRSGVEITQGKTASADIFVGIKKTSSGKGGLSLTLTDSSSTLSNIYSNLIISLKNLNGKTSYTYSSVDKSTFNFTKDTSGTSYSLASASDNNLESGWYLLSITIYDYNYKINLSDSIIEIADGITTTGTISLSLSSKKTYYAANGTTANGNGLAAVSRINLSTLLENLASNSPDEGEIDIYVNGTPEIDLDKFAALKTKLAGTEDDHSDFTEKSIYIYNSAESTETAAISLVSKKETSSDGTTTTYTTATDIAGALTLTAGTETTLDASTITVDSDSSYTITLANGAALNVTGDISSTLSGTLGICAVKSDGSSDNFGAYTSTANPFITTASSIKDNIALYEYGNDDLSNCYTVAYATESSSGIWTYNYKIKPVVGSIILANGKLVAPSSYTVIDESNPPIAIAVGLNSNDKIIGIGLHTSTTSFYWATVNTTGSTTNFPDIVSTATESQVTSTLTYSFTGDTDGSDNWDVISSVDENAETTAETNYPAFYWANNYASTYNSYLGGVTDGWYMPSIAELYIVFKNNIDTLNSVLASINALKSEYSDSSLGDSRTYWSSSQTPSTDYGTYLMSFINGSITAASRYNKGYVLVVRAFN